jgi:hypothetical protein
MAVGEDGAQRSHRQSKYTWSLRVATKAHLNPLCILERRDEEWMEQPTQITGQASPV